MRPHRTPVFTIATKLAVGLIDPVGREWLHWNRNKDFMNRMIDINLAFTADLVVTDGWRSTRTWDTPTEKSRSRAS
jgi:uncharacterized protein (DUF362 family)